MVGDKPNVPKPKTAFVPLTEKRGAMLVNPGIAAPPKPSKLGAPPNNGGFLVNPGQPSAPAPPQPKK